MKIIDFIVETPAVKREDTYRRIMFLDSNKVTISSKKIDTSDAPKSLGEEEKALIENNILFAIEDRHCGYKIFVTKDMSDWLHELIMTYLSSDSKSRLVLKANANDDQYTYTVTADN